MINKSSGTNLICLLIVILGHTVAPESIRIHVLAMGYFGLSGAITNWLAIHMLFERVPGLYGSGIIPLKFEAFKGAIREMIMTQFFTVENIEKFLKNQGEGFKPNLEPVIETLNYDAIFDAFLEIVQNSKFGGMLGMFGGAAALEPMRDPFAVKLKEKLIELVKDPSFLEKLAGDNNMDAMHAMWQDKIAKMVDGRLDELTPQMVKEIIQNMIRSHLGWLVIWGGVFGSVIGLLSSLVV